MYKNVLSVTYLNNLLQPEKSLSETTVKRWLINMRLWVVAPFNLTPHNHTHVCSPAWRRGFDISVSWTNNLGTKYQLRSIIHNWKPQLSPTSFMTPYLRISRDCQNFPKITSVRLSCSTPCLRIFVPIDEKTNACAKAKWSTRCGWVSKLMLKYYSLSP